MVFFISINTDLISRKLKLTYGYESDANSFIETTLILTTIRLVNNRVNASIPSYS